VFQTFNLLATMSAYENVELPMTILGKLSAKQCKKRTRDLLARTGFLPLDTSVHAWPRVQAPFLFEATN
jgi:predicted ABC-type transport system involved in lysophospholipase L1 biosynthesis ATPase subunit